MDEIKGTESIGKNAELTELPMGVQTSTTILENWQYLLKQNICICFDLTILLTYI